MTAGNRYWGVNLNDTDNPVAGQGFAYAYDNIGNRLSSSRDSEEVSYTANSLNAYSLRTVSDLIDILGSASTNTTVKVNNLAASRHGKYWHKGLTVTNTASAAYPSIEVIGIDTNSTTNTLYSIETGNVFVAKTPELFTYDDDGNLTSDGRFSYTWDCEGHLIGADTLTNLPASVPLINANYSYDYMSRRSRKAVGSTTNTFVYNGWNLIREVAVTSTNTVTNSYVWGIDLSGSLQGAGGVGGLLCVIRNGVPYYPCYDANGNITEYVDTNGVIVAHREYDAFGNTIVATGLMVNDFSFWFSTKYLDRETGLYYYGYRYYSPSLGRFLSRDPIGEQTFIEVLYFHDQLDNLINKIRSNTHLNLVPFSNYNKNDIHTLINDIEQMSKLIDRLKAIIVRDHFLGSQGQLQFIQWVSNLELDKNKLYTELLNRVKQQDKNPYLYVENNPICYIDYLGLILEEYRCTGWFKVCSWECRWCVTLLIVVYLECVF